MIEGLRPYPDYRPSGHRWLGNLPAHWKVEPCRHLFTEVRERNPGNEMMLSVTIAKGVVPQSVVLSQASKKDTSRQDKSNYKLVQIGDIAYNKMRAWQGSIGLSKHRGIISPAYVVQRPRNLSHGPYFHQLFRTPAFAKEAERWSYGITSDMWSLRPEHFKSIFSAVPPPDEQAAIVRFLDHANRRIDRFIRAKKKLIALLNEQKQAIIQRAVTRGLDPNVKMKDSGVPWLGEVPEHWEVRPLKLTATIQSGITIGKDYGSQALVERPYLRVANVQSGRLDLGKITTVRLPVSESARSTLQTEDVLMTEGGDADKLGRGCIWTGEIPGCLHQNHIFAVRTNRELLQPKFLEAVLGASYARDYFIRTAKQTTNLAATNKSTLGNLRLCLPPVPEQITILEHINSLAAPITNAVRLTNTEIQLAMEYRTRLIADVVTGQLDVRAAAASLPDLEEDDDVSPAEYDGGEVTDDEGEDLDGDEAA